MTDEKLQWVYKNITQPIAKFIDFVNIPKRRKLEKMRKKIARDNMIAYIEQTSNALLDADLQEHLNKGMIPNPLAIPLIVEKHILKAHEMFYEKKKNGDFDELNLMIN